MAAVEKLIDRAFALRGAAHAAHWKATGQGSYARHTALGEFYDGLIDGLDRYVEAHQGTFGLVGKLAADTDDIVAQIRAELVWLTEHRSEVARGVPALENILDELAALHMSTLYKLENLR
jgi:hypothetical protein